jgi:hypothetical protein
VWGTTISGAGGSGSHRVTYLWCHRPALLPRRRRSVDASSIWTRQALSGERQPGQQVSPIREQDPHPGGRPERQWDGGTSEATVLGGPASDGGQLRPAGRSSRGEGVGAAFPRPCPFSRPRRRGASGCFRTSAVSPSIRRENCNPVPPRGRTEATSQPPRRITNKEPWSRAVYPARDTPPP